MRTSRERVSTAVLCSRSHTLSASPCAFFSQTRTHGRGQTRPTEFERRRQNTPCLEDLGATYMRVQKARPDLEQPKKMCELEGPEGMPWIGGYYIKGILNQR